MVQYEAAQSTSRLASTERIPRALKKKKKPPQEQGMTLNVKNLCFWE